MPLLTTWRGPRTEPGGVEGEDLAGHPPVEEHPESREVLLDARRRERAREFLYMGGDDHGLDTIQGDAPALAPCGEPARGREIGETGVRVPDVGGEELPEQQPSAQSPSEKFMKEHNSAPASGA